MTWFAFKGYNGGKAVDIAGSQEKLAASLGFHGYSTQAQAQQKPNSVARFPNPLAIPQKSFVNMIIADYGAAVREKAQPGGKNANILNPGTAASAGESYVGSYALGWLTGLGGDIGSGIESGVVSALQDIWNVIYPALEIIGGIVIAIIAFTFIFKDELIKLAPLAAAAAA